MPLSALIPSYLTEILATPSRDLRSVTSLYIPATGGWLLLAGKRCRHTAQELTVFHAAEREQWSWLPEENANFCWTLFSELLPTIAQEKKNNKMQVFPDYHHRDERK